MLNSDPNDGLKRQDSADKKRAATFPTLEVLEKSALLKEFVNLFHDAGIQAMLLESEMQVMEQGLLRWIGAITYYDHLGKRVEDYIQANSEQWAAFRDATGVIEVEIFTRPFTNPKKCLTRINLKGLGGWNDSPVKSGVLPALV